MNEFMSSFSIFLSKTKFGVDFSVKILYNTKAFGGVAQLVRAHGSHP